MDLTLSEELLLLALDDAGGQRQGDATRVDLALAGGWLLDLALAGRLDVVDEKVVAVDQTPVGHPDLDGALARIAGDSRRRKPEWWLGKLRGDAGKSTIARLLAAGLVRTEERRVLGIFPVKRYPAMDGSAERDVRARLSRAVLEGAEPDERTAALASLVHAAELERHVFPDADRKTVRRRLKELSEGEWAGEAVRKAVRNVQAATQAAVIAATTAATSASS